MTNRKSSTVNRFIGKALLPLLAVANLGTATAHPPDPNWANIPNGGGPTIAVVNIEQCTNVVKQDGTATSMIAQYISLIIDDVQFLGTWGTLHQEIHDVAQNLVATFSLPINDPDGYLADSNTNDWFWYNWKPANPALPVTCDAVIDPPYADNTGFSPSQWGEIHSVGPITIYQPPVLNPNGMTWKKLSENAITGTVTVGCGEAGDRCDPYVGDQACTTALPVLCFKADSTLTMPISGNVPSKYYKWANGLVATTTAVSPAAEFWNARSDAEAYCVAEFGAGWDVASFHQGWGWNFQSYGNTGSNHARFWVNISDQQTGNCWPDQN